MKFVSAATALLVSSLVKQTSAFSPIVRRNVPVVASVASHHHQQQQRQRAFVSATGPRCMANVLKLTEPQTQLLDEVDVFIFDCDGVIWRVRFLL
jgi:hypothetical protein